MCLVINAQWEAFHFDTYSAILSHLNFQPLLQFTDHPLKESHEFVIYSKMDDLDPRT